MPEVENDRRHPREGGFITMRAKFRTDELLRHLLHVMMISVFRAHALATAGSHPRQRKKKDVLHAGCRSDRSMGAESGA